MTKKVSTAALRRAQKKLFRQAGTKSFKVQVKAGKGSGGFGREISKKAAQIRDTLDKDFIAEVNEEINEYAAINAASIRDRVRTLYRSKATLNDGYLKDSFTTRTGGLESLRVWSKISQSRAKTLNFDKGGGAKITLGFDAIKPKQNRPGPLKKFGYTSLGSPDDTGIPFKYRNNDYASMVEFGTRFFRSAGGSYQTFEGQKISNPKGFYRFDRSVKQAFEEFNTSFQRDIKSIITERFHEYTRRALD